MRIRTRRSDQRTAPEDEMLSPVTRAPDGYIVRDDSSSLVQPDGSLIASVWLNKTGHFLMSIELDDAEVTELLAARLRLSPAATVAAIGNAMTVAAEELGTVKTTDVLLGMGIDRSRNRESTVLTRMINRLG